MSDIEMKIVHTDKITLSDWQDISRKICELQHLASMMLCGHMDRKTSAGKQRLAYLDGYMRGLTAAKREIEKKAPIEIRGSAAE